MACSISNRADSWYMAILHILLVLLGRATGAALLLGVPDVLIQGLADSGLSCSPDDTAGVRLEASLLTRLGAGVQQSTGPLASFWSGGRTKHNRITRGYDKDHWIDAACVGKTGANVHIPKTLIPLQIRATGRQSRQMCRVDRYGFPRTKPK